MGKFSIIDAITPFQIMRNIFIYHREMVVAKNKLLILLLPESLIADNTEDKLYKMQADGILPYDDTEDAGSVKAQQIRMLNAANNQYISELGQLIDSIKADAREIVDMNAQRYGQIIQSAGATTTQNAISQSAMGTVIINQMFDEFRRTDYNRDIDFGKLTYIDGLNTSFTDVETHTPRYISLDVNSYVNSDLSVTVRNASKETDKVKELKQWAFSAAQNGDLEMAMAAIDGNNSTQIKATISKFMEIKRKHEEDMQQTQQMIEQQKIENKIREIQAKGEEDRKLEEIKYYYAMQLKGMDIDAGMLSSVTNTDSAAQNLAATAEENKRIDAQEKNNIERQKIITDTYNKAADRQLKLKELETQLKIAKTNKNKYDK
jgi:hypothetical protein